MANTYTYSGPATRWSEGDPTAVDYLNVSRVNSDHLYEALNTIIVSASITAGAATALKDGTTATTQGSSDNTTKLATTAWVTANATTNPAGSDTQIQYNNSGAFGASANLTFDGSVLKVGTSIAATADTNTSIGFPGSDVMTFSTGGTEALRINDEGVLGIKTTPAGGWHTDHGVLQIGTGALWVDPHDESAASNMLFLSNNLYRDSADEWRHIVTDEATRYYQYNGEHYFDTAPSGSAGAAASFANRLKIASNGYLTVGSTGQKAAEIHSSDPNPYLVIAAEAETQNDTAGIAFHATKGQTIGSANTIAQIVGKVTNSGGALTGDMIFYTNGGDSEGERMRISSAGATTFNGSGPVKLLGGNVSWEYMGSPNLSGGGWVSTGIYALDTNCLIWIYSGHNFYGNTQSNSQYFCFMSANGHTGGGSQQYSFVTLGSNGGGDSALSFQRGSSWYLEAMRASTSWYGGVQVWRMKLR